MSFHDLVLDDRMGYESRAEQTSTTFGLDICKTTESVLTPSDLILCLASVSPIWGNVRLQKESFLLWKEHQDIVLDPEFHSDGSGPYSRMVSDAIPTLKAKGFLEEMPGRMYYITKSGRKYITSKLQNLGISSEQIGDQKRRWDEWDLRGITAYIYRSYL